MNQSQTFGANNAILKAIAEGAEEPAHMLNSETLLSAARCLDKSTGQLIIVTDNRWYANLICATFLKLLKNNEGMFFSANLQGKSGMHQLEVFQGGHASASASSRNGDVILYEGQPNESIGHSTHSLSQGSTYFDRLWRKGAGTHADAKKRFIICMCRSRQSNSNTHTHGHADLGRGRPGGKKHTSGHNDLARGHQGDKANTHQGDKKNRKRSAAQQQKRNERRMQKKS